MLLIKQLFCYLFFIIFLPKCGAKNYCEENYCNNTKQHTLCKYQSDDPARHCVDYERTIQSEGEKLAILDKLNSRRNKVASGGIRSLPAASNMMKLEWNDELELSAQRWADQCVKHRSPDIKDACRDMESVNVEQNIASIYGEAPGLTPLALVDVWYMELLNVNASVLLRYQKSKDIGYSHYDYFTQLVWANTKEVGCGGVKFKEHLQDSESDEKRVVYRLVCNFAPGGNIFNESAYDAGPPCTQCPNDTCDPVYTALCMSYTKPPTTEITSTTKTTEFEMTTNIFKNIMVITPESTEKDTTETTAPSENISNAEKNEDNITLFDFYSHMHEYITSTLATTTTPSTCKDLDVDEFVELLKRKLSTDPMFKELLQQTSSMTTEASNSGYKFTDALALLSKLYSKDVPSTATPTSANSLNSTLLVDLVEAVIFRNGIPDAFKQSQEAFKTAAPEQNVIPVRIQAELAERRENSDFNGHLFFPEDLEEGTEAAENTENYYEMTYPFLQEAKLQILRRSKVTKDFLEDILDSDVATERTTKIDTLKRKRDGGRSYENVWNN